MSKTSSIPSGVTLEGDIEGRGDLVVAGTVDGPIELEGSLVIEEGGHVRGDVHVTHLVVRGVLAGDAVASETVRIEPSAVVVGDARAPRVQIVDGAKFRGRVQMTAEPMIARPARRSRVASKGRAAERPDSGAQPDRDERPTEVGLASPLPGGASPEGEGEAPRRRRRRGGRGRRGKGAGGDVPQAAGRTPATQARSDERASADAPLRAARRPPPPNVPSVGRQKARRRGRDAAVDAAPDVD